MKHSMNDTMEEGLKVSVYLTLGIVPATGIYGLILFAFGNDFSEVWFTTAFAAFITGVALGLGALVGSVYGLGYLHLRYAHRVKMSVMKKLYGYKEE